MDKINIPIETAPKDGTYIWLGNVSNRRVGWWNSAAQSPKDDLTRITGNGWSDAFERFYGGGSSPLHFSPTHWQHLPDLPEEN